MSGGEDGRSRRTDKGASKSHSLSCNDVVQTVLTASCLGQRVSDIQCSKKPLKIIHCIEAQPAPPSSTLSLLICRFANPSQDSGVAESVTKSNKIYPIRYLVSKRCSSPQCLATETAPRTMAPSKKPVIKLDTESTPFP